MRLVRRPIAVASIRCCRLHWTWARDPRHGRMEECYGEDPFLASRMGVEFIKGVQKNGVVCSPKHFLANFVTDGGRDSGNAGMSERELREIHMPPFRAAVKEAGVKSLMAAYNSVDGIPCSANRWLLTDVLPERMGIRRLCGVGLECGEPRLRSFEDSPDTIGGRRLMCESRYGCGTAPYQIVCKVRRNGETREDNKRGNRYKRPSYPACEVSNGTIRTSLRG